MTQHTPADIENMARLALGYAQRLGIESDAGSVYVEKGTPSAGLPWRLYVATPINGGSTRHAPAFLTDHGFIGWTKAEAFKTLNDVQWALHSALLGLASKGIRL